MVFGLQVLVCPSHDYHSIILLAIQLSILGTTCPARFHLKSAAVSIGGQKKAHLREFIYYRLLFKSLRL